MRSGTCKWLWHVRTHSNTRRHGEKRKDLTLTHTHTYVHTHTNAHTHTVFPIWLVPSLIHYTHTLVILGRCWCVTACWADPSSFGSRSRRRERDVGQTHAYTHTHQGRRYWYTGQDVWKQTQPGKERGHPQAFCISTTVSDISLAKQSVMDVCSQDFSCFSWLPFFSNGTPLMSCFFVIFRIFFKSLLCSRSHPQRCHQPGFRRGVKHPGGRQFSVVLSVWRARFAGWRVVQTAGDAGR